MPSVSDLLRLTSDDLEAKFDFDETNPDFFDRFPSEIVTKKVSPCSKPDDSTSELISDV